MASKSSMYAMYEAVQHEMRQRKDMTWLFELTPAVASNPGLPVINLQENSEAAMRGAHRLPRG